MLLLSARLLTRMRGAWLKIQHGVMHNVLEQTYFWHSYITLRVESKPALRASHMCDVSKL